MKKCPNCGKENKDDAIYCDYCSSKIDLTNEVGGNINNSSTWDEVIQSSGGQYDYLFENDDIEEINSVYIPPANKSSTTKTEHFDQLNHEDFSNVSLKDDDKNINYIKNETPSKNIPSNINQTQNENHISFITPIFILFIAIFGFAAIFNFMIDSSFTQTTYDDEENYEVSDYEEDDYEDDDEYDDYDFVSDSTSSIGSGTYYVNYIMKIRNSPSLSATQIGRAELGTYVQITQVLVASDGSYWGKISGSGYICISDGQNIYLSKG